MPAVLKRIEEARARGLDVTANQYPYTRASNDLDSCLPLWVREGSQRPDARAAEGPGAARAHQGARWTTPTPTGWENQWYGSGGGDGVMVASVLNRDLRKYEGMTLTEIGRAMGKDPRDALMDLVIADQGQTRRASSASWRRRTCGRRSPHPLVSIDTDSGARAEDGPLSESRSHPRAWGTFAADSRASTCATRNC